MSVYKGVGYTKLTVSTTPTGVGTIPTGADRAMLVVETAAVRWRDDGTNPSATDGVPLTAGDGMNFDGDLTALKFIRSGASDATIHISFYR